MSRREAGGRYRCHACGTTFSAWAPAERHADSEHHPRIELVINPTGGTMPKQTIAKDRRQGEKRMGEPRPNAPVSTTPDPKSARKGNQ